MGIFHLINKKKNKQPEYQSLNKYLGWTIKSYLHQNEKNAS